MMYAAHSATELGTADTGCPADFVSERSNLCCQCQGASFKSRRGSHRHNVRFALNGSLPRRLGVSRDWRSPIVMPAVTGDEIGFEFFDRQTFPLLGLIQQRPALKGPEGRSLTVQGSGGAIAAHLLHDGFPIPDHELIPPSCINDIAKMRRNNFPSR